MTVRVAHRLALVLIGFVALANAGFGGCGDLSGPGGGSDGGSGSPDLAYYEPASDLGAMVSDGSAPQISTVQLTQPAPFSSNVSLNAIFDFDLFLVSGTPQDLEPLITIIPRGSTTALNGGFSWKQTGASSYQLSFTPTGLVDKTDYVVTAGDPSNQSSTLLKTGVSTGSHPRVSEVQLTGENMASSVFLEFYFSESMNAASVITQTTVTAGTGMTPMVVTGTVTPIVSAGVSDKTGFRFDFDNGKGLPQPITLHVGASSMSTAGTALDTMSWDSTTQGANGDFFVEITAAFDTLPGTTTYRWDPVVF